MATIVVVDDEPAILSFVVRILEAAGHTVIGESDGEPALRTTQSEIPDVVVLDVNLPRLNGLEVCRILKSDEATKHIGIVLMTAAYTSMEEAQKGEDSGADEYVIKPFLREVLLHNVERLLTRDK
ncbi:MAG: response regulator [Kofleriaceae bacterium]|nr:response regulator [Kofleriaceae bacterium]